MFNKPHVYNNELFLKALRYRPKHVPLITVSNHQSCFDDPGIWGNLTQVYQKVSLVFKKK